VVNAQAEGDVSLATPFFAQLLQAAAKEKKMVHRQRWGGSYKRIHQNCKRCAKKGGGAWLGGGSLIDAHTGAHLSLRWADKYVMRLNTLGGGRRRPCPFYLMHGM